MKPLIVHCSAGVGRTGVFIASMISLKRMQEENKMDLFQITKHMRTQRMAMIQTPDQYAFVYRIVLDWLDMSHPGQFTGGSTSQTLQQQLDRQLPRDKQDGSDTTRQYTGVPPPTYVFVMAVKINNS